MDELLYETLKKYYKTLSIVGYKEVSLSYKILIMQYIQELFDSEFRYFIKQDDIKIMQDLLYQFIGSTCEITFPTNCKCCCTIINGAVQTNPTITNFKLVPSDSSYTGDSTVTFTGATFNINKGTNFKDNSLEIMWNGEVIASDLGTSGNSITFTEPITKELLSGNNYNVIASIQDNNGTKYYSNTFTINVEQSVDPIYIYTGNTEDIPTVAEIQEGIKYNYSDTKQFNTPRMTLKTVWVCLPKGVELLSMENVNFQGDFLYNSELERDLLKHQDISLEGKEYTLHYFKSVIATMNPYITKIK